MALRADQAKFVSTFQCSGSPINRACPTPGFDKAGSIGRRAHAHAIFAENCRSSHGLRADHLSPATAPARSRRVSSAAVRASIATAPKERRRLRDISRQIRTRERLSPEEEAEETSNVQHRTLNLEFQKKPSAFHVGCWKLSVRCLFRLLLVDASAFYPQIKRSSRAPVAQLDRASDYGSEG